MGVWNVTAGDLNADGEVDFVSTPPVCGVGSGSVVYGPQSGLVDLVQHALVDRPDDSGTCSSAVVGDVDGDGFDDMLIGDTNAGGPLGGGAYLFSGPVAPGSDVGDATATLAWGAFTGERVAAGGDINADGYDDLLISSYQVDPGKVYVVYGPVSGDVSLQDSDAILLGEECQYPVIGDPYWVVSESHFGQSIASADLNSDGFSDVIVGAPGAALFDEIGLCALPEGASSPPGVAYVFYGPLSGQVMASMADASLSGVNGWDRFGSSVSGAGDVNGDGAADLLVGGAQMGTGAVNSGGAFVAFGPFGGPASYFESAGVVMLGELSSDAAGTSVTGGSDINNDGYDDIVVGAPGEDTVAPSAGAAYVLYGGPGW